MRSTRSKPSIHLALLVISINIVYPNWPRLHFFHTHGSRGVLTEVSWASRLLCLLLNIHGHNFTLAAEFTAVGDLCLNQLAKMLVPIILDGVYSHCYCCRPSSQFNFTDFSFTALQNHKMWCEFWVILYTDTIGYFFCASFTLLCWQTDVYWFASVTLSFLSSLTSNISRNSTRTIAGWLVSPAMFCLNTILAPNNKPTNRNL